MDGEAGLPALDGPARRLPRPELLIRCGRVLMVTPAAAVVALGWATTGLQRSGFANSRMDFWIYFHAVRSPNLYDYIFVNPLDGSPNPFKYPPFAAMMMTPFRWVAERPAEYLWTSLSVIAATVALYLIVRELVSSHGVSQAWVPWLVAVGLMTIPVVRTLQLGQINEFVALLVAVDVVLVNRRSRWAGVGIGLAVALKLTPAVFIPVLLFNKSLRRSGRTASLTALGATVLAFIARPGDSVRYWSTEVFATGRVDDLYMKMSGAFRRFTMWLPGREVIGTSLWLLAVLALVSLVLIGSRRLVAQERVPDLMIVTGVLACVIFPITWPHHMFFAVPAVLVVACRFRGRLGWSAAAVGLLLFLDPFERGDGPYFTALQGLYMLCFVVAVCAQAISGRAHDGSQTSAETAMFDSAML
jgi:alpha-1,2-mannosyltransferase